MAECSSEAHQLPSHTSECCVYRIVRLMVNDSLAAHQVCQHVQALQYDDHRRTYTQHSDQQHTISTESIAARNPFNYVKVKMSLTC